MTHVSIVVPTRNRPRLLACTLRSILAQRFVEFELIVVDDASTPPVVVGEDSRIQLVRHETPRGVSAARNTGLQHASGQWVAFCDDDDVWAPDKLAAQLGAGGPAGAGWVYTGVVTVDEDLRVIGGGPPPAPADVLRLLGHENVVPGSASGVTVTMDLLARVGGFDPQLRRTEDWDMWLRLARTGPPTCVPRPLVALRQHVTNVVVDRERIEQESAVLVRRYDLPLDRYGARRRAAWGLLRTGRRVEAAREYLWLARHGDRKSLARAAVALLHPAVGTPRLFKLAGIPNHPGWIGDAREWLAPLAEACNG